MTQPSSTKDHRAAPPQAKGLGAGQVVSGKDWTEMLPTQKLLDTNLAIPESFILIGPPIQKLVHIMWNTKAPNDKHATSSMQQMVAQIKNRKA